MPFPNCSFHSLPTSTIYSHNSTSSYSSIHPIRINLFLSIYSKYLSLLYHQVLILSFLCSILVFKTFSYAFHSNHFYFSLILIIHKLTIAPIIFFFSFIVLPNLTKMFYFQVVNYVSFLKNYYIFEFGK